jgi:hypothetical protein
MILVLLLKLYKSGYWLLLGVLWASFGLFPFFLFNRVSSKAWIRKRNACRVVNIIYHIWSISMMRMMKVSLSTIIHQMQMHIHASSSLIYSSITIKNFVCQSLNRWAYIVSRRSFSLSDYHTRATSTHQFMNLIYREVGWWSLISFICVCIILIRNRNVNL